MKAYGSIVFAAAVLIGVPGCAHNNPELPPIEPQQSRGDRDTDVITAAALDDPTIRSGDVLEAVRRLRPQFLVTRGSVSIRDQNAGVVHASIDFGPLMTVDNLKRVRVAEVSEIRYLNARDAALRFGTMAGTGGVIVVKIRH